MLEIRAARPGDVPFITAHWLKSYRNAPAVRGCPNKLYYNYHHRVLEHILVRATTLLAVNEKDDNEILGFATGEFLDENVFILHYVFVKDRFRRLGVAKKLVNTLLTNSDPAIKLYTAKTRDIFTMEDYLKDQGLFYGPHFLYVNLPLDWDSLLEDTIAGRMDKKSQQEAEDVVKGTACL